MPVKKFIPLSHARKIIRDLRVHRLSAGSLSQLISHDSSTGLYVLGDDPIEFEAQQRCGLATRINHVSEIVNAVRRNAPLICPGQLNGSKQIIVIFKNGILDVHTLTISKHSPTLFYTIGIPHDWVPHAVCPNFDRFVSEILPEEMHRLLREIMGLLLIPYTRFRKFFVFLGQGANGKSTLIAVIVSMLDERNVSHQSLHQLVDNRFGLAELYGKLANTYADLESDDVKSSGLLKQIVSGDSLQCEKKFRDPFTAPVTARLLFSANRMPIIRDTSEAISDRLILLEFPNRFPEEKQDKELIDRLTTQTELEGIIARWAIPGLQSLLQRGRFDLPQRSRELIAVYRDETDPFHRFASEQLEIAPGAWLKKNDAYGSYTLWCFSEGVPQSRQLSRAEFNRRICETFGLPNDDRRIPGSRDRAWEGIRQRDEDPYKSQGSQINPRSIPGQVVENIERSQESQVSDSPRTESSGEVVN